MFCRFKNNFYLCRVFMSCTVFAVFLKAKKIYKMRNSKYEYRQLINNDLYEKYI